MNKFAFLTSTRFWALVGIAIVEVLENEVIIGGVLASALITILGGFSVIRTIDRFSEKIAK